MTNKMTYAVALSNAIALTDGETRETLERLLESVNKRNSRKADTSKPTKKQVENEGVKEQIRSALSVATEPKTCKEIAECLSLSVQKVNALLTQMKNAGEVVRSEGKKKVALFALADAGATSEGE